ncbi:hypothetical protein BDA96_03G380000 [Sorghum bicolor]|uniref:Uncharacterized protein n=2 Tax=Sorghum bicolor TaxID=4558 RepID=A0A921RGU2_SORBI|nr:hypothetical protein BDA96_03G380000 [Sorghum bicolor]OQU87841.1 hypothetical protein SORBI_3003G352750 [Sorghum bicolor]
MVAFENLDMHAWEMEKQRARERHLCRFRSVRTRLGRLDRYVTPSFVCPFVFVLFREFLGYTTTSTNA